MYIMPQNLTEFKWANGVWGQVCRMDSFQPVIVDKSKSYKGLIQLVFCCNHCIWKDQILFGYCLDHPGRR